MQQYIDLIKHINETGTIKSDRTGTGTKSIFGYQMRFDLQDNFPLVTSKKTNMHMIIVELLWFLRGDTNTKFLTDNGVKIWEEWKDEYDELGPVYGKQWRSWDIPRELVLIEQHICPSYEHSEYGLNSPVCDGSLLYDIWLDIIHQFNTNEGIVNLNPEWFNYDIFASDVRELPNYHNWKRSPSLYKLNPCYYSINPIFNKHSCVWSTLNDHFDCVNGAGELYAYQVQTNDTTLLFLSLNEVQHMFPNINIASVIMSNGEFVSDNITISRIPTPDGYLYRNKLPIDQIQELITQIKTNPDSRRLIVTGWNPSVLPDTKYAPHINATNGKAALPPCHTLFQFYVLNGKLSCQLYQRSADVFLGVPFNIASYSLLTHMIAQVCDLEVGEFIHTFGDAHLYINHQDQVDELLSRSILPKPILKLNPSITNIFDFNITDITLEDYVHHPYIKAPIAV